MFRCGWCGAISEAAPADTAARRPRTGGPWRSFMRLLTRLTYIVVLFVLGLIASIVLPGIGLVLPYVCRSTVSWLAHVSITYMLTAAILWNYLAAVFTSPGTPLECCEDLPPAFRRDRSMRAAAAAPAAAAASSAPDAGTDGCRSNGAPHATALGGSGSSSSDLHAGRRASAGYEKSEVDEAATELLAVTARAEGDSSGGGQLLDRGCGRESEPGSGPEPGRGRAPAGEAGGASACEGECGDSQASSSDSVDGASPGGKASTRGDRCAGGEDGGARDDAGGGGGGDAGGGSGGVSRRGGPLTAAASMAAAPPAASGAEAAAVGPGPSAQAQGERGAPGSGSDAAEPAATAGPPRSPSPQPEQPAAAQAGPGSYPPLVPQLAFTHLRYCWQCHGPQPAVARHCYPCGVCVVDQDHHCPFINNCVGRANMRNFLSFLAATLLAMGYCACMCSALLARDWDIVRDSSRAAAEAVAASRLGGGGTAAGAGGSDHSGLGGWLFQLGTRFWFGVDSWFAYMIVLVGRTPLRITAAAYMLLAAIGIFCALSVLFAQSLEHAASGGCHAARHLAAAHAARHNMHPASDAASDAVRDGRRRRWAAAFASLRCVMCGVERPWRGAEGSSLDSVGRTSGACGTTSHAGGSGGGGERHGSERYGSAWLWVWPLWGPPPGVLVPEAAASLQALEPDRRGRARQRQRGEHTAKGAAGGTGQGALAACRGWSARGGDSAPARSGDGAAGTERRGNGLAAARMGAAGLGWGWGWAGRKAKTH